MDTLTLFPLDGFEPGTPEFSQLESDETNAGVQIQAHTAEDFDTEVLESVAEPVTRNVLDQRAIASDDQDVLAIYGAKGSRDSRWLGSILPGGPYPISRLVMIFPIMDVEAYSSFVQDVDDHGRGEPAWVWNGEVIDGKHYVWACLDLGIEPQYADLPDDVDPVRYLWSRNVERRHLTTSQRALIAAELSAWSR